MRDTLRQYNKKRTKKREMQREREMVLVVVGSAALSWTRVCLFSSWWGLGQVNYSPQLWVGGSNSQQTFLSLSQQPRNPLKHVFILWCREQLKRVYHQNCLSIYHDCTSIIYQFSNLFQLWLMLLIPEQRAAKLKQTVECSHFSLIQQCAAISQQYYIKWEEYSIHE